MNPYAKVAYINLGDGDIIVERKVLSSSEVNKVKYHTVKDGETLQSIAFQYFGDSGYWGDIADINNILFPFEELYSGMQILIPDYKA